MKAVHPATRVLLLVEDNPGDADLFRDMMGLPSREDYDIVHVTRLAAALDKLRSIEVDVVVLDLRLPDCAGVETVKAVRQVTEETPIVVLTGSDDEHLATACIDAGAQDYLAKAETRASNVRRSIGYAISRQREVQLRNLQRTLEQYRALSSSNQATTITAAMAGSGAVKVRDPNVFQLIADTYYGLFEPFITRRSDRVTAPRSELERIVTMLGDANGGPRDLLDVHLAALERAMTTKDEPQSRLLVFEARLLALEMMGLLVDYYRVGQRRRFLEGMAS